MTATDSLRHLHDRLRSGVALVSQLEDRLRDRAEFADKLTAFARVSDYLQEVMTPHLRAERSILFPEVRRLAGVDPMLVDRLAAECEELDRRATRVLHDHARFAAGISDNASCRRHITALVRLLRRHLHSVEEDLLDQLGAELGAGDVHDLYERLQLAGFEEQMAARVPPTAEAAVAMAQRLRESQDIGAELFFLSEYVSDPQRVESMVTSTVEACRLLGAAGLGAHVSVDPTAIGLITDADLCVRNAERIVRAAAEQPPGRLNLVTLDMEDLSLVEPTLRLHAALAARGLAAGITLQARLRRTARDVEPLLRHPTAVRLVKGAYSSTPEEEHQGQRAVSAAYLALARSMLSAQAREAGFRPIFATHDHTLVRAIREIAEQEGWPPDRYEFEMLYGIRVDLQRWLSAEGHTVRAHVPFGPASWPYTVLPGAGGRQLPAGAR